MNVSNVSLAGQGSQYYANTTTAAATAPAQQSAAQRQLIQAARTVNQSGTMGRNQIVFSIDSETRHRVVLIEDRETHAVVQQIPPEFVLELAKNLGGGSNQTPPEEADT